jgi:hypothetical protein
MRKKMTELTLEALRDELAPMRVWADSMPMLQRALTTLQDDMRELRDDVDKLIALTRSLHEANVVTGGALVRIERRLDRIDQRLERLERE